MGLRSFFTKLKNRMRPVLSSRDAKINETVEELEQSTALVPVEALPTEFNLNQYNLTEISDPSILDQLSHIAPGLAGKIKEAGGKIKSTIYRATIPAGASVSSISGRQIAKTGANAVAIKVACSMAGLPGLALSITSQVLMFGIHSEMNKLQEVGDNLTSIAEAEYKGKIASLIIAINKILSFKDEIMNDEELRKRELDKLDMLEVEASSLLLEINELILSRTRTQLKFQKFLDENKKVSEYLEYQFVLENILYRIAELRYALNLGRASRQYCLYALDANLEKTYRTNEVLLDWQRQECDIFAIDFYKGTRKREGVYGAFLRLLNRISRKEVDTVELKTPTRVFLIKSMRAAARKMDVDREEKFAREVTLIGQDGKVYCVSKKDGEA